jgi:hypothetical protein
MQSSTSKVSPGAAAGGSSGSTAMGSENRSVGGASGLSFSSSSVSESYCPRKDWMFDKLLSGAYSVACREPTRQLTHLRVRKALPFTAMVASLLLYIYI